MKIFIVKYYSGNNKMEWSKDTEKSFSYWTQYLGNHKIKWFINLSAIGHYLRFEKQF